MLTAWRARARTARCARSAPASGSCRRKARPAGDHEGNSRAPSSGSRRAYGIPWAASTGIVAASQPSSACAIQVTPLSTSSSSPDSASSSRHRALARRADAVYSASAPWPQRISRDSPPEVARSSPGSNWSTSVTATPSRASSQARAAPNVPAPTTTALSIRGTLPGGPSDDAEAGRYPRIGRPPVGSSTLVLTTRPVRQTCGAMRLVLASVIFLTFSATAATTAAGETIGRSVGRAAAAGAETIGRSVEGRAIALARRGDPAAAATVLVVGSIHGTEQAGHAVVARLRRMAVPAGVRLLLVRTANPDGVARGTRQNARGVDLNRNFPFRWRPRGRAVRYLLPRASARRASRRRARCAASSAASAPT